jgi:hypothetical protein
VKTIRKQDILTITGYPAKGQPRLVLAKSMYPRWTSVLIRFARSLSPTSAPCCPCANKPSTAGFNTRTNVPCGVTPATMASNTSAIRLLIATAGSPVQTRRLLGLAMNLGASLGVKMVPKAYRDSYLRRVSGNGILNLPIGLLRATVFRHFLGFSALRGTSRSFTQEV